MQQIGRYSIIRELGKGAMGIVYEAMDTQLNRTVALKVLNFANFLDGAAKRQALERFMREGKIAAGLMHPNIAQVYDAGEDRGHPYLVMELCEGTTLSDMIRFDGRIPEMRVISIADQLLSALTAAHEKGIIHRDIKPENIMLSRDGRLKLMDFGIAKIANDNTMTQTGQMLGSPLYMSPEQVLGRSVDQRSDIFSLGTVLYECLSGVKPYEAENLSAVIHKIAYVYPPPVTGYPPFWTDFLYHAMDKNVDGRYKNALEMQNALRNMSAAPASSMPQPAYQPQSTQGPFLTFPQPVLQQKFIQTTQSGHGYLINVKPHRSALVMSLGVIGIFCCGVAGVFAWIIGSMDLQDIDKGKMDPAGRQNTQIGMILGVIGTILLVFWIILFFSGATVEKEYPGYSSPPSENYNWR